MARRRRWSFWMPALEHPPILWADDLHRGRFTIGGRVLFWGVIATGTLLLGEITTLLLAAFSFGLTLLTLAWVVGWFYRPRLELRRDLGPWPSAGEIYRYSVRVKNTGRRTARNILVEERSLPPDLRPVEEPPVIDELEPGESTSVRLALWCGRRGVYELTRLQGATALPLGLLKFGQRRRVSDRLLVCPRVTPVTGLDLPAVRHYQPGGIPVASHVGDSTEFSGTRDWRQGDRVRDIHWPSSARVGRLIAREFQEEYFVRLAVVLDIGANSARAELWLEDAISLTAGLVEALARRDNIVDLFAAGPTVYQLQAGRALAHFEQLLDILACVEPGVALDAQALEEVLVHEAPRLSAVIFVMLDWEPGRAGVVQTLRRLGVAVRVICVRPGVEPTDLSPEELVSEVVVPPIPRQAEARR